MAEYSATREGFQKSMQWSYTGPPEETEQYIDATATPDVYLEMNNKKFTRSEWIADIARWRARMSDYKPVVDEFLRDGDRLAARMTGTTKVDGEDWFYECWYHAKVDPASGKLAWLKERVIWGKVGEEQVHGAN